jgi:hypothetical protein
MQPPHEEAAASRIEWTPVIVTGVNALLVLYTTCGPLGLAWLALSQEDKCALMGIIPLQGPAALLSIATVTVGLFANARAPTAKVFKLVLAAALVVVQAVFWWKVAILPDANKC